MGIQKKDLRGYNEYYIGGAAAPKIIPQSEITQIKKTQNSQNAQKPKSNKDADFAAKINKAILFICSSCICALIAGGIIVSKFERISVINTQIGAIKDNIVLIESKIASLETQYECSVDMAYLQNIATIKFKMHYPGSDQVKEMKLGIIG